MLHRLVLAVVLAMSLAMSTARAEDKPPIFANLTFDKALEQNTGDKLLIVKFTATWCPPCKQMDKTTWRDEKIVSWMKDRGTVIAIDVDAEPEVSKQNRINAMPTMVVFKAGKELDRVVGYQSADQLVDWLESALKGETGAVRLERSLKALKEGSKKMPVQERMDLARQLVDAERYDDATEQYAWLWDNMVKQEPAMVGVRGSFLIMELSELIEQHEPARAHFTKARDTLEASLKDEKTRSWDALTDWVNLNQAVGDEDRTLAWIDRLKGDDDGRATLRRLGYLIDHLLEERDRWDDLLIINPNAAATIEREAASFNMAKRFMPKNLPKEQVDEYLEMSRSALRSKASKFYNALLKADRAADAEKLARVLCKHDDTAEARMSLIANALDAGLAHEDMRALASEAQAKGGDTSDLVKRLDARLKKP